MKLSKWTLARHLGFESAIFELDTGVITEIPYDNIKQRVACMLWWEGFKEGWLSYPNLWRTLNLEIIFK